MHLKTRNLSRVRLALAWLSRRIAPIVVALLVSLLGQQCVLTVLEGPLNSSRTRYNTPFEGQQRPLAQ
jgi:hypothetical protein